ncbi:MAG: phosphatidylserine decarboxylase [Saccharothrix sp.]|nr:phosphatidylserine decarboxylase [Saccharothrix sp.]
MFGHAAGYLPQDRKTVDDWHRDLREKADGDPGKTFVGPVRELQRLLDRDQPLRDRLNDALGEAHKLNPDGVKTIYEVLYSLDHITKIAPEYHSDPTKRNYFPMSTLFCYLMAVPSGWELFLDRPFNDALREILKAWCAFLDSDASTYVLHQGDDGWLGRQAVKDFKLVEFEIDWEDPHGGFDSYNAFFHRQIKPEVRPLPDDPAAVVSANDGRVSNVYWDVERDDDILLIKDQRYSLDLLLDGYSDIAAFEGGNVFQSFLSGANYHRWHAPVGGKVVHAAIVPALMFSELYSKEVDLSAGTLSQGYQANVNTRAIVVIESTGPDVGKVGVVPVGITEISSVTLTVRAGDVVERGQEIGYFSYGGSSMCLVFEQDAVEITAPYGEQGVVTDDGAPILVNATIARKV